MAMFLEYKTEEFVYKNLWFKMVAAYKNGVIEMTADGLPKMKSFDSHRKNNLKSLTECRGGLNSRVILTEGVKKAICQNWGSRDPKKRKYLGCVQGRSSTMMEHNLNSFWFQDDYSAWRTP